MSKKLSAVLVPLLGVVAFAMVPAAAQATYAGQKDCHDTWETTPTNSGQTGWVGTGETPAGQEKVEPTCPKFGHPGKTGALAPLAANAGGATVSKPPNNAYFGYLDSSKLLVLSWGKLALNSELGNVTCQNLVLGREWNPKAATPAGTYGTENPAGKDETVGFFSKACEAEACPIEEVITPEGLPWVSELVGEVGSAGGVRDESRGVKVKVGCGPEAVTFETNEAHRQTPLLATGAKCNVPTEASFDAGSGSLIALGTFVGTTTGSLKTCGYEKSETLATVEP